MTATVESHAITTHGGAALLDGRLHVRHVSSRDPAVIEGARRHAEAHGHEDLGDWARTMLELGAQAAALASDNATTASLDRRLDDLTRRVAAATDTSVTRVTEAVRQAADADSGTIAVAVGRQLDQLATEVRGLVAGEEAPVRTAVERAVHAGSDAVAGELHRALAAHAVLVRSALAADDPTGPWHAMRREVLRTAEETRRELTEQLSAIRAAVDVNREHHEMLELTAVVKGAAYESAAIACVERAAHGMGDTCEAVGTTVGRDQGRKTGDAVVTVSDRTARGRQVKLVVEAKDATWGPERWRSALEAARHNRGADAAIGVVNGREHMPGGRLVHFLDPLNCLICVEPGSDDGGVFAAGYQIVRLQAVTTVLAAGGRDGPDLAAARAAVDSAVQSMTGFDAIDRAASGARRSADQVARAAADLRSELSDRLARAAATLNETAAG